MNVRQGIEKQIIYLNEFVAIKVSLDQLLIIRSVLECINN
ncbi:MAG: hypothetical protein HeimC3_55020 [Candidatus Heimdallarchaeota archaeon LC_3]|nr:MAG: hypothetical protein HeimC3_55020 [Candidatus Heimdallarchaeota archaeon LC_3]